MAGVVLCPNALLVPHSNQAVADSPPPVDQPFNTTLLEFNRVGGPVTARAVAVTVSVTLAGAESVQPSLAT